jgi:threonyl-tRNA synthetase
MAVVGAKEVESDSLSIRTRASGELGAIPVAEVLEKMQHANTNRENF